MTAFIQRRLPLLAFAALALAQPQLRRVTMIEGGGYFPVTIRLKTGEIVSVVRGGARHIGVSGRLDLVTSADEGTTWSAPRTVVDGPNDDRNPALGQLADGTLVLAYAIASGYDETGLRFAGGERDRIFDGVWVMRSRDRGITWSTPERSEAIHSFYAGRGAVSPYGKIVQLPDATILMPVYFQFFDERGAESHVFQSSDGGKTWGNPTLVARGFNETALALLPGGKLLAALRSRVGQHVAIASSGDAGRTWSDPQRVTEDMEHPADLLVLPRGRVLLTFGDRIAPRGVQAMLSRDGGKSWGPRIALATDATNTDCGYPSSAALRDGRILTTYYQVDDLKEAPRSAKAKAVIWSLP